MKILALDGNSIINRAFYGIKPLTTKDGRFTNAVYGFINILTKLIDMEKPDGVVAAFDLRAPTFRHKMYPEYKAGRKPMPEELAEQLPVLKQVLNAFGYTCLECEGFEADDILGTLAAHAVQSGDECVISTGDRDSLQLVSDKVKVLLAATRMGRPEIINCDENYIMEKYGVKPKQLIEIKGLQGDASDNIPGVAGVGEKTAGDLIKNFASIENIYDNVDTIDVKEGVRTKLKNGKDSAFLSRELGIINCAVPCVSALSEYKNAPSDNGELMRLFTDLEFFKFIEKFGLSGTVIPETTAEPGVEWMRCDIDTVLKNAENSGVLDLIITADDDIMLGSKATAAMTEVLNFGMIETLKSAFENEKIAKRTADAKGFFHWCAGRGITPENVAFDSAIAAYLINPAASGYDTVRLAAEYAVNVSSDDEFTLLYQHSGVCDMLTKELVAKSLDRLFYDIELPLAKVLCDMEIAGFAVDTTGLIKHGTELGEKIVQIEHEVFDLVGYEFNLNSPKQLGEALFEKLGLPARKKTKSGYSTGAEVLEELKHDHPAVNRILEYRHLAKLKSTYCDGLAEKADSKGRIHSTLNQTETRTGRISSTEPNLQNIPVRTEEGRILRKFFGAADGYVLCDADYSQIELRVLAHMSNDKTMIDAFLNGDDIHTITASQVFGVPIDMVTKEMRSRAKAVNFGIVYGIGAFSLAKDIGVTRKEADDYINGYFATYPNVRRFMDKCINDAKASGFALTMYGRRRPLPELASSNHNLRSFGERVARNMPIQGTAADIIKIAMLKVADCIKREKLNARLILQVHDELIVEARTDIAQYVCDMLEREMEAAASLAVPLSVEANFAATWFDAK